MKRALLVILIVALFVSAACVLFAQPLLQWGMHSFETWFAKSTSYELRVGSAHLHWSHGLVFNDVILQEKNSAEPLLTLRELHARPRWRSLLKRELIVEDVTLVGPSYTLDMSVPTSTFSGLGILKEIHHIEIEDGRFVLRGETDEPLDITPVSLSGALHGTRLNVDSYSVTLGSQTATGGGHILISSSSAFDLNFALKELSVGAIVRRFGSMPDNIKLSYTGQGRVKGTSDHWDVESKGKVADGSVSIRFARARNQTLEFGFNRIALAPFAPNFSVGKNTMLTGRIRAESALDWRTHARASGTIHADRLARNRVRSNLVVDGSVDLSRGRGQTAFTLTGDALAGKVKSAFDTDSGVVNGAFDFVSPRIPSLQLLYQPLSNWQGALTSSGVVNGVWTHPSVNAVVHVTNLENDTVSIATMSATIASPGTRPERFLVDAKATAVHLKKQTNKDHDVRTAHIIWNGDANRAQLEAHLILNDTSKLDGKGPLARDAGDLWRWQWSALSYTFADMQVWTADKDGVLEVSADGNFTLLNLKIARGDGLFNLKRLHANGDHLDASVNAVRFPLDVSVPVSSSSIRAKGTLDFDLSFNGSLVNPQGKMALMFSSGTVNGYAFRRVSVEATASDGLIHLQKGEIESSVISEPARFEGNVPWDWVVATAPDVAADVRVSFGPVDPAAWIQQIPHAVADAGGSVKFDGHVRGSRRKLIVEGSLVATLPRLRFPDYKLDLRDISVDIQNENEIFRIKQGSARLGKKGSMQLSGVTLPHHDLPSLLGLCVLSFLLATGGSVPDHPLTTSREGGQEHRNERTREVGGVWWCGRGIEISRGERRRKVWGFGGLGFWGFGVLGFWVLVFWFGG